MIHLGVVVSFLSAALLANAAAPPNAPPTFATATPYPTPGSDPNQTIGPLTTVDLNGDGKADLLFIDPVGLTILVEPGNGNGTFLPPASSPLPSSVSSIDSSNSSDSGAITGDFNGDGITDLLLYTRPFVLGGPEVSPNVQILFGNGDGTFRVGPAPSLGIQPLSVSIVAANFNGDKATDLFLSGSYLLSGTKFAYEMLNNGDGTFGNPVSFVPIALGVIVADVNGDGISDLIAYGDGYQVFLNIGNGSLTRLPPQSLRFQWLSAADFDHDGKADLVYGTDSSVVVLPGNGDGTFRTGGTTPIALSANDISFADVNGDGFLDFVNSDFRSNIATVALGGSGLTFQTPAVFEAPGPVAGIADVNSDAKADVIVTGNFSNTSAIPGYFTIVFGQATPAMKAPRVTQFFTPPGNAVTADFNGDGKPDVVAGDEGLPSLEFLKGNGDGSFAAAVEVQDQGDSFQLNGVVSADFNRDGKPDVAAFFENRFNFNGNVLSILLGNGDGTFQQAVAPAPPPFSPFFIRVADLNRDGIPDIYMISGGGGTISLYALLGNGDGTFRAVNNILNTTTTGFSNPLDAASLNSNGDLILFSAPALQNPALNLAQVLISNGDGTFQAGGSYYPLATGNLSGASIAAGDVNSDGIPDLVVVQKNFPQPVTLAVLTGTGNHTFAAAQVYIPLSFTEAEGIALADLNHDGYLDIVLPNEILVGNGDGTFQPGIFLGGGEVTTPGPNTNSNPDSSPVIVDVNGDGKPDVLFPNFIEAILNTTPAPGCASGTEGQISVVSGGFQFDHAKQSFVQTVTLTNNGPQAVGGPILLALDGLGSNATLQGAGGVTQCSAPLGSPWITVVAGTLGVGQSDSVALTFYDPKEQAIHYTPRVLYGSGQP